MNHVITSVDDFRDASNSSKTDTSVKCETLPILEKLNSGLIQYHTYGALEPFDPDIVIKRAKAKVGRKGIYRSSFDINGNNCETFAIFARTGASYSIESGFFHIHGKVDDDPGQFLPQILFSWTITDPFSNLFLLFFQI